MRIVGGEGQDGRRARAISGRSKRFSDGGEGCVGRRDQAQRPPSISEAALDLRANGGAESSHQQSEWIDHWETPPDAGGGAGDCPAGTTAQGLSSPRDEEAKAIYAASAEGVASFAARSSAHTDEAGTAPEDHRSIFRANRRDASRLPFSISLSQPLLVGAKPSATAACSRDSPRALRC